MVYVDLDGLERCIMRGLQYSVREGVIVFTSTRMDTMMERLTGGIRMMMDRQMDSGRI